MLSSHMGFAFVLLGACLPMALADNLFAGCYATTPETATPPSSGPALRTSSLDCSNGCTQNTHSFFNASSGECFCSNGTPYQNDLRRGNVNECGHWYENRNIRTSYMALEPACYDTLPEGITPSNTETFTGLNSCLNSCRNGLRATFWADRNSDMYFCSCVFPSSYGAEATCGRNAYFGFYHTPDAAASGLTKRRHREELARKAAEKQTLCPNGWTACSLTSGDDQYECIDVTKELESCGGCLTGQFNAPDAKAGQDCTQMEGSVAGGATCSKGQCVAFACKEDYKLVDGKCVLE